MNKEYEEDCYEPMNWFEGDISDVFVVNAHLRDLFQLPDNFYFVMHDCYGFYWSRAENNQLACLLDGEQTFWPIGQLKKLEHYTLVLFYGMPNRLFVLGRESEISIEEYRKLS